MWYPYFDTFGSITTQLGCSLDVFQISLGKSKSSKKAAAIPTTPAVCYRYPGVQYLQAPTVSKHICGQSGALIFPNSGQYNTGSTWSTKLASTFTNILSHVCNGPLQQRPQGVWVIPISCLRVVIWVCSLDSASVWYSAPGGKHDAALYHSIIF